MCWGSQLSMICLLCHPQHDDWTPPRGLFSILLKWQWRVLWKAKKIMGEVCIPSLGCRYSVSVTVLVLPHKAASAWLWAETGLPINWRGPVSTVWSHREVSNPSCTNPSNVQRQLSCPLCVFLHRSVFSFLPWSSYFPRFPDPLSSRSLPFVHICQCPSKNIADRTEGKALNLVSPAQRTMGQWPWSGSREKSKLSLACASGSLCWLVA